MPTAGATTAVRAATLATMSGAPVPRRGPGLGAPELIRDGVLAWSDGVIDYAGPVGGYDGAAEPDDLGDVAVIPGFVECHTHVPFFGWRADEYEARLAGRSYRDLHGEGGIYRSARMLTEASDEEVISFCRPVLAEMLAAGTTALELKTGYGLSVGAELRQARLARRLAAEAPQTCTVTLQACHAVPSGMAREEWVRLACDELIPAAAREGLVEAVDVYVEDIAFSLDDLRRVAAAATDATLPLRCHADQLGASGAAQEAVRLGARSADHLNHVDADVGLQPGHVAGAVDAGGGGHGVHAVPAHAARGAVRGDGQPSLGARPARTAGLARARETGRFRRAGLRRPRDGPLPSRPQPGDPDVDRRDSGVGPRFLLNEPDGGPVTRRG